MSADTFGKDSGWTMPKRIQTRVEITADGKIRTRRLVPGGKDSIAYPSIFSRLTDPDADIEFERASYVPDEWLQRCDQMRKLCASILRKYQFPDNLEATVTLQNDAWQTRLVPLDELSMYRGSGATFSKGASVLAQRYPGSPPAFAYWGLVSIEEANHAFSKGDFRYALARAADAAANVMKAFFAENYERFVVVGRQLVKRSARRSEKKRSALSREVLMVEIRAAMSQQKISFSKASKDISKKYSIHETQIRKMFKASDFKEPQEL